MISKFHSLSGFRIRRQSVPSEWGKWRSGRSLGSCMRHERSEGPSEGGLSLARVSPPAEDFVISSKRIENLLSFLPEKHIKALEKRYGLSSSTPQSLQQVGDDLGISREAVNGRISRSFEILRLPDKIKELKEMRKAIKTMVSRLLSSKFFVSMDELKSALTQDHILKPEDKAYFGPILYLLEDILGQRFKYVNLERGRKIPRLTGKNTGIWENIGICRKRKQYLNIFNNPKFSFRPNSTKKIAWRLKEYHQYLKEELKISISFERLKLLMQKHAKTAVLIVSEHPTKNIPEEEVFVASNIKEKNQYFIRELIRYYGPLHNKQIEKLVGIGEVRLWQITSSDNKLVSIGDGIYDVLEKHEELENVPPHPKNVDKKSALFPHIYSILFKPHKKLRPHEIHQILQKRNLSWSLQAVNAFLNNKNYKDFFTKIDGKYELRRKIINPS